MKKMIKSVISCALSAVITAGAVPCVSAFTEDIEEQYPYTMFAASCEEGAVTLNTDNFCVNGNVATNGTIVSTGTVNVNGTKTENAGEQMVFIFDKIDARYFESSDIDEHQNDFILDESNINIDTPTEVQGEITLTGNICIDTALKSMGDVDLLGEIRSCLCSFRKCDDRFKEPYSQQRCHHCG